MKKVLLVVALWLIALATMRLVRAPEEAPPEPFLSVTVTTSEDGKAEKKRSFELDSDGKLKTNATPR